MQRDLVVRAREGDHDAFSELAAGAIERLLRVARLIVRDDDRAQDAVQDALVTAWLNVRALRDPDRFDAWTYRLIVRASTAEARKAGRTNPTTPLLPDDADASRAPDQYAAIADRDQLERGFRRLTAEQRSVLVLQHYAGLSQAEIADVLGIPVGTAGSRIHYAARALRAAIEADIRSDRSRESVA